MFCYKCGTELPDDAVFCAKCGTKMIKTAKEEDKFKGRKSPKKEEVDIEKSSFIEENVDKVPVKNKKAKGKSIKIVLVAVCALVLISAVVFALNYFKVIDVGGLLGFVRDSDTTETTSADTQEQQTKSVSNPTSQPLDAHMAKAVKSDFYGEWIFTGLKDHIEDEISPHVDGNFYYLKISGTEIISGTFLGDGTEQGPYETTYAYKSSGGINNCSYLDPADSTNSMMLDSEGHLLEIIYNGDGTYETRLAVYEKLGDGSIASYEDTWREVNQSYTDDSGLKEFYFLPLPYEMYIYTTHWIFTGVAANPYTDEPYNKYSMLEFDGQRWDDWFSYVKFDYRDGTAEYYSSTMGEVAINFTCEYSDEFGCYYYNVEGYAGDSYLCLNFLSGDDYNLYMCPASPDDHSCLTNFYVYETYQPESMFEIINYNSTEEDFIGVWKSTGVYFDIYDNPNYFQEGDFNIFEITPDNYMLYYLNVHKDGEDHLSIYEHYYTTDINVPYYLDVENFHGEDNKTRLLYFIDTQGRLLILSYKLDGDSEPYLVYLFYERYYGTVEECIESFN